MDRRQLLAALSSGAVLGFAGCIDEPVTDGTRTTTPTATAPIDLSAHGPIDGWSMYRADAQHTGRVGEGPGGELDEQWTASLGRRPPLQLAVAGETLLAIERRRGTLAAFGAVDGERLADDASRGDSPASGPVAVDGVLYYGTKEGELVARATDGSGTGWRVELPRVTDHGDEAPVPTRSTPAVAEARVYVVGVHPARDIERKVLCFEMSDPDTSTDCDGWPASAEGTSLPPPVVDEDLVVVQHDQKLLAFDADEGSQRWRAPLPDLGVRTRVEPTPALGPERLYVRTEAGLQARTREDGDVVWTRDLDGRTVDDVDRLFSAYPAAVNTGAVYAGFHDGRFEALDRETGEPLWTFEPNEKTVFWTAPALDDAHVYVGAHGPHQGLDHPGEVEDARFYALDRVTGEVVGAVEREGEFSDPAVGAGGVYVAFGTEIVAFS